MTAAGPTIILEQLMNEIQEPVIAHAVQNALKQKDSIGSLLKPLYKADLPEATEMLTAFENKEPTLVNFLLIKRKLLNLKKWLAVVQQTCGVADPLFIEAEAALNDKLLLLNAKSSQVYAFEKNRFPSSYDPLLDRVDLELEQIMLRQDRGETKRQFLDLTKQQFRHLAKLALEQQDLRLQALLHEAKSLYFTQFPKLNFSLLSSWTGTLYVVMDVIGQLLGKGETKLVTRALELKSGKIVALLKSKTVFQNATKQGEEAFLRDRGFFQSLRESDLLLQLSGTPGIISVSERFAFEIEKVRHLFLVEDRYEDGTLASYLRKALSNQQEAFDEKTLASFALQLLTGLSKLHNLGMIHRDIKPDNILCDWTNCDDNRVVICDFNLACSLLEIDLQKRVGFSHLYGAPEYVQVYLELERLGRDALAAVCTPALDVWGMGLIFYQLFFLEALPWDIPLHSKKDAQTIHRKIGALKEGWIPKKFASHRFYPLIEKMLRIDRKQRVTATEALVLCLKNF